MWPYIFILGEYLNLQNSAVFALRDLMLRTELRTEDARHLQPAADYARLHEVARLAMLILEVLTVNIKMLRHMVESHKSIVQDWTCTDTSHVASRRKTHQ
jgi:hypothetical protein